jgi:hypothetical protein
MKMSFHVGNTLILLLLMDGAYDGAGCRVNEIMPDRSNGNPAKSSELDILPDV